MTVEEFSLPRFTGFAPVHWLYHAERYFVHNAISDDYERFNYVLNVFDDEPFYWFNAWFRSDGLTWTDFTHALSNRFKDSSISDSTESAFQKVAPSSIRDSRVEPNCLDSTIEYALDQSSDSVSTPTSLIAQLEAIISRSVGNSISHGQLLPHNEIDVTFECFQRNMKKIQPDSPMVAAEMPRSVTGSGKSMMTSHNWARSEGNWTVHGYLMSPRGNWILSDYLEGEILGSGTVVGHYGEQCTMDLDSLYLSPQCEDNYLALLFPSFSLVPLHVPIKHLPAVQIQAPFDRGKGSIPGFFGHSAPILTVLGQHESFLHYLSMEDQAHGQCPPKLFVLDLAPKPPDPYISPANLFMSLVSHVPTSHLWVVHGQGRPPEDITKEISTRIWSSLTNCFQF